MLIFYFLYIVRKNDVCHMLSSSTEFIVIASTIFDERP